VPNVHNWDTHRAGVRKTGQFRRNFGARGFKKASPRKRRKILEGRAPKEGPIKPGMGEDWPERGTSGGKKLGDGVLSPRGRHKIEGTKGPHMETKECAYCGTHGKKKRWGDWEKGRERKRETTLNRAPPEREHDPEG